MTEWTDRDSFRTALERAITREKGTFFEEFVEGETIRHGPGLRLTRAGNEQWMSQTCNHQPAYWRADVAREYGFDRPPIHPDYILAATMGPSVEDLSEKGGYFLGRTNVRYHAETVYSGTELTVESEVLETRPSRSRPAYGIVTWRTQSFDADGKRLCSYERTNMVPRREPLDDKLKPDGGTDTATSQTIPTQLLAPDGDTFEAFDDAMERARNRDGTAAVAYRHERGRTMDDVTVTSLPLATLNTAKQHHNDDVMAEAPSGEIVTYGDVTRSTALGHARADEATARACGTDDERFHTFVTAGDTVYCFTRVLETAEDLAGLDSYAGQRRQIDSALTDRTGAVAFEHIAFNQHEDPVYSGRRTALVWKRAHSPSP